MPCEDGRLPASVRGGGGLGIYPPRSGHDLTSATCFGVVLLQSPLALLSMPCDWSATDSTHIGSAQVGPCIKMALGQRKQQAGGEEDAFHF